MSGTNLSLPGVLVEIWQWCLDKWSITAQRTTCRHQRSPRAICNIIHVTKWVSYFQILQNENSLNRNGSTFHYTSVVPTCLHPLKERIINIKQLNVPIMATPQQTTAGSHKADSSEQIVDFTQDDHLVPKTGFLHCWSCLLTRGYRATTWTQMERRFRTHRFWSRYGMAETVRTGWV